MMTELEQSIYGEELDRAFWCESEGMVYFDEDEHPARFVGLNDDEIDRLEDGGHFGYACPGAGQPLKRVAIVELLDATEGRG